MASDPVIKAVLLRRQFDLPIADVPKLDDAIDALAWKLIGFGAMARKFDAKAVKTALILRELGDGHAPTSRRPTSRRPPTACWPAAAVRVATTRRSCATPSSATGSAGRARRRKMSRAPDPELRQPLDPSAMAGRVQAAARSCPTGRYGDHKVFIAHVWDHLRSDPDFAAMDLDGFKRALAEANNLRLLDLARADLVQAMDPEEVRRSEVRYLNATFHFVRI